MSDPLSISLVPGALPNDNDPITPALIRAVARPTISLAGTIGAATINDGAVTTAKLASGVLSADATGRSKMEDGYVTAAKLDAGAQGDVHQYAAGVYAAGVYAVTLDPVRAGSYVPGEVVRFKADTVNTGAADININGRGAANLYKFVSTELAAGDIPVNTVITAVYDGSNFQVVTVIAPKTYTSSQLTLSGAGLGAASVRQVAHSLGATPSRLRWVLVCQSGGNLGYAEGDEVNISACHDDTGEPAFAGGANATYIWCVRANDTDFQLFNKSTGTAASIDETKWKVKGYAEL